MSVPGVNHYAVLQQAAAWYARLGADDSSALDRHKWEAWLRLSQEHRQAWDLVEKIGGRFAHFSGPDEKKGALKALQSSGSPLISRRQTLLSMAVLSVAGMIGWEFSRDRPARDAMAGIMADYSTATGETRAITLKDGSLVWLNTASALNVELSLASRRLHLLTGEALIMGASSVSKNTVASTRHGQALAGNAQFSVRLLDDATCVTVHAGEVLVTTRDQRCNLRAGQQMTISAERMSAPLPAAASAIAWTRGVLVAEGIALGAFISELSRYRHGYLGCSEAVAGLRVMGTFSITDTDRALSAMASALPVTLKRTLPWWVIVEERV